jgi:hypothetical protein
MPRYIDADTLKESLKNLKAEGRNQKYVQGLQDAIDDYFPQIIDDVPTADVEPVRHGRWYEYGEQSYKRCSICHERYSPPLGVFPPFCLNCGAKMDGGENK